MAHPTRTQAAAEAGTPLPARWIDLGRVSLRYARMGQGQGRPLVLLHEMAGSIETWDRALPLLAAGREVIAYDWRGFGQSEKVRGTITLDDHVGDLVALLDALGIEQPVTLSGIAVGAAIACAFAAAHPGRCAGLALMSPAMEVPPETREERHARIDDFLRTGLRSAVDASLDSGYPPRFREGNEARFASFRARWLTNDPESFAATFRMLVDLDPAPILAAIRCPVLMIAGLHDPLRGPDYVRSVADRITGAERVDLVEVPGGHHMPHQIPEIVADLLDGFGARQDA